MNVQKNIRRGFTLIELMIVIVILGILMGTILPRLTGAQARARDTARRADLTNIAQALEVYFNDNGQYPTGQACLDPDSETENDTTIADALGSYMKGNSVPMPASVAQNSLGCVGSYFYQSLEKSGVPDAAYILASDVETWQMANYLIDTSDDKTIFTDETYANVVGAVGDVDDAETIDGENALQTVYVVTP